MVRGGQSEAQRPGRVGGDVRVADHDPKRNLGLALGGAEGGWRRPHGAQTSQMRIKRRVATQHTLYKRLTGAHAGSEPISSSGIEALHVVVEQAPADAGVWCLGMYMG